MENTYSLTSLEKQQAVLQKRLDKSQALLAKRWDALTQRPKERNGAQHWIYQMERVAIIYDGVMTGYKLFRRLNNLSGLFRKRAKR